MLPSQLMSRLTLAPASVALRRGVIALLLFTAGCDSAHVAEDLSQKQARQIVAVLNQNGIAASAERQSGSGAKYRVEISKKNYARATALLNEKHLPQEEKASFEELTASNGLLPRSREMESLALDRALAVQLEELLLQNPKVRSSKVVVRLNYLPEKSEPSASISVVGDGIDGAEVLALAQRVVPGVTPGRVSLALYKEEATTTSHPHSGAEMSSFLFGVARVPEEDYIVLAFTFIGSLFVVAFAGGLVGYWYGLLSRGSVPSDGGRQPDRSSKPMKLDKPKRDLTEM